MYIESEWPLYRLTVISIFIWNNTIGWRHISVTHTDLFSNDPFFAIIQNNKK